jgi:hypothetical protein
MRRPVGVILGVILRSLGVTAVLVVVYFLAPLDHSSKAVAVSMLAVGLVALISLVTFQTRQIVKSSFPVLRALEAVASCVPLFVLLFASAYLVASSIYTNSFSQSLNHTSALYFAVTVFTTVGFGDITPKTQTAQVLVTLQMVADLVIIGLAIKVFVGAAQRRRRQVHRAASPTNSKD